MVTFRPDVGYSEALRRERWQKDVIGKIAWTSGVGLVTGIGVLGALGVQRYLRQR